MSSCKEALVHNLSEPDANRVVTVLAKEQLLAEKRAEGNNWSVVVDSDQFLRALEVLEVSRVFAKGTPHESRSSSFVRSKEEIQWELEREISSQLEETLLRLPNVLEARVHLFVFADNRLEIRSVPTKKTASVLLVVDSKYAARDEQVKAIVSGASGIETANVTIVTSVSEKSKTSSEIVQPVANLAERSGGQWGSRWLALWGAAIGGLCLGVAFFSCQKFSGKGRLEKLLKPKVMSSAELCEAGTVGQDALQ